MNPNNLAAAPTAADVVRVLAGARFRYRNEIQLHEGLHLCLATAGMNVTAGHREVVLSRADRIDFLLDGGLGVEVKVKGPADSVRAQLLRYAGSPRVRELLLITTRAAHAVGAPDVIGGKSLTVFVLRGGIR